MTRPDSADRHLAKMRGLRTRPERDLSMQFLQKQFKQQVERPYKQLAVAAELWRALIPADLQAHTRLESLVRGVLRVAVDSSPRLYELDRLLRQGLERQIIVAHKTGSLRKIQLRVAPISQGSTEREPDGPE